MRNHPNISEEDWKKWKKLRLQAIDRFCNTTFEQVQQLAAANEPIHDRHRKLYQLVAARDNEIEALFDPLTRSRSFGQLAGLCRAGLVTNDELTQFSDNLQEIIQGFLSL